ncbi:MAG: putative F0F1-ATPase subunit Ca2+/Mg2+ transporter [Clostridiales bacterium]|nr:putative F0F1-ATPase subunit Ca2+/Mg2+ transporter [Clostridiales bacterium]MDN5281678.1 putative F0F1-ATPase subunit Ca2+/Mg2+ transporter [Candidatus Ozemobacter sp.]
MTTRKKKLIKTTGFAGKVLSTGLTGGICVAISLYFGYQFDLYFDSRPIGILGGIFVGLAAAGVQTWKQLKESLEEFENDKHRE